MKKFAFKSIVGVIVSLFAPVVALASEAEGGHGGGTPHLPNLVKLLVDALYGWGLMSEHTYHIVSQWTNDWISVIYAFFTTIIMAIIVTRIYAKRQMIPGKAQNMVELLVESLHGLVKSILGDEAKKYTPFLGTLFFYVLFNNIWGIIPGGYSPSTNINTTAALAIMVFLYAQYTGVRRLGVVGYLDHMAGQPRSGASWAMVWLIFPIHIVGELAKPFSLAVRLFGNITGEDVLVAAFVGLGITALSFMHSPVGLPLNVPFIMLGLMLSTIQALVFTILSTIYILLMLPHEEGHH